VTPEVAAAVEDLVREGVLTTDQAALPLRAASGEIVSVRTELRTLLWLGVTLIASGVGLLVKENLDRIGPVAIAAVLGAGAAACLLWVARMAGRFSWFEQPSPNLVFDYVLLLGVTLLGADLAFIEVRFTALGANWPWHLLGTSVVFAALALRFDSRMVFSLALSTFAAWRGVSMGTLAHAPMAHWDVGLLRANAIACGVLFILVGAALLHWRRKPHFEPVAAQMGWLLVLGASASGMLDERALAPWGWWAAVLLAAGGGLAWYALRARRFWLFAMGLIAAYSAVCRFVVQPLRDDTGRMLWFLTSSVGLIVVIVLVRRRLEEAP